MEIVASLEDDIAGGRYPIGSSLPAETELSAHFGVSRFTVREALRQLMEMGLVERRQGARSTVKSTQVKPEYRADFSTIDEVVDFTQPFSPRYLDIKEERSIEARGPTARFLRCRPGREWRVLKGPRRDGRTDEIVAACEVYLWAELEGGSFDRSRTIASQICERNGLEPSAIEVELSAVSLSEEEAALLGSEPGSPGLQVVRRFLVSRGRAFEVVRNVFKGGLVNYSMMYYRK